MHAPDTTSAWSALEAHYATIKETPIKALFAADGTRGERLTAEAAGVFLDYSKNRVTDETLTLLLGLADAAQLRERIDAMFAGEKINVSENRAVLARRRYAHRRGSTKIMVDGKDVVRRRARNVLDKMSAFADRDPQRCVERPYRQVAFKQRRSTSASADRTSVP